MTASNPSERIAAEEKKKKAKYAAGAALFIFSLGCAFFVAGTAMLLGAGAFLVALGATLIAFSLLMLYAVTTT
jgi:hypothetical protein